MKSKNTDLTQGVVWKQLVIFFLPMMMGSLFQQLYTTADAMIVGQLTGKGGLAAIDAVTSMLRLPVNFFVGLSTGATIIISQYYGAHNHEGLSKAMHTAITFAGIAGIIVSVIGLFIAPMTVDMLGVPEDIYDMSLGYVRVYFGGLFVSLLYNIGAGILRAIGNSKTPFYILAISGAVNVVLDLIFVGPMKMGAMGAGLATVLSQAVSAAMVVIVLMQYDYPIKLQIKELKIDFKALRAIFSVGFPIALQSSLYPITNMTLQASVNATGTDNIAAWALCGKLDMLLWLIMDSLSQAVSTFVAQNYGAGLYKRAKKGINTGHLMTSVLVIILSAIIMIWCVPLGKLFLNKNDYNIAYIANDLMKLLGPTYILYVSGGIFSSAIRGTGESFLTMVITLVGTCVVRMLWVFFVIPLDNSLMTILWSYPISWAITSGAFIIYYLKFKKRKLDIEDIPVDKPVFSA